jgi:hypothetical protein
VPASIFCPQDFVHTAKAVESVRTYLGAWRKFCPLGRCITTLSSPGWHEYRIWNISKYLMDRLELRNNYIGMVRSLASVPSSLTMTFRPQIQSRIFMYYMKRSPRFRPVFHLPLTFILNWMSSIYIHLLTPICEPSNGTCVRYPIRSSVSQIPLLKVAMKLKIRLTSTSFFWYKTQNYVQDNMKTIAVSHLLTGPAAAHSAVWNITFDGTLYVYNSNSIWICSGFDAYVPIVIRLVMVGSMILSMRSALNGLATRPSQAIPGPQ